jgi:hypothetical protein
MTEPKTYTLDEAQLYFAKTLNGKVWELLGKTDRSLADNEQMMHDAHASCSHWLVAGTPLHHQRAEWLIAHVYTVLGYSEPALRHALLCMVLTQENASLMQDFDWAYAHEGLARALALAGNRKEAQHHLQIAQEKGEEIRDEEDKSIFVGDLEGGDWYNLQKPA